MWIHYDTGLKELTKPELSPETVMVKKVWVKDKVVYYTATVLEKAGWIHCNTNLNKNNYFMLTLNMSPLVLHVKTL